MSKVVKGMMIEELKTELGSLESCIVVGFNLMAGERTDQLRRRLREEKVQIRVLKNTLSARAFKDLGREGLSALLKGPSAIVFGGEDIVGATRTLADFIKKHKGLEKNLEIRGGFIEGKVIDHKAVQRLTLMPTKPVLLAQVLATTIAPLTGLLGDVQALLQGVAGGIAALQEKQAKEPAPPQA